MTALPFTEVIVGVVLGIVMGLLGGGGGVLAGFVVLLLAAGVSMLRGARGTRPSDDQGTARPQSSPTRWTRVVALASIVGFLTGLFGVGGGFIVVPALVVALAMPIRRASATALVVIIVNTLTSLVAHGTGHLTMATTMAVAAGAGVGGALGAITQPRVSAVWLQRAFGALVLSVACYEAARLALG